MLYYIHLHTILYFIHLYTGAIVLCKDAEEANYAITCGARSICLYNMDEVKLVETRKLISVPGHVQIGAKLRPEGRYTCVYIL